MCLASYPERATMGQRLEDQKWIMENPVLHRTTLVHLGHWRGDSSTSSNSSFGHPQPESLDAARHGAVRELPTWLLS
jgi:hypothetical protein